MAVYRKVNTSFWEDEKVIDEFTPEDKYFMLYLMTNPHVNQIGCYQITIRQMEFETGYNKETIVKLITRFEKTLKVVKYSEDTKEMFILNWSKYNWSNSPKVIACILKEAESVKNKQFRYSIDTLLIQYGYSMHTQTQEKEKEKEEEEYKEKKSFKKPTLEEVKQYCFERNNGIDAEKFIDSNEAKGWMIGKNKMKDWKAAIRTWERNQKEWNKEQEVVSHYRLA